MSLVGIIITDKYSLLFRRICTEHLISIRRNYGNGYDSLEVVNCTELHELPRAHVQVPDFEQYTGGKLR